jgi:hypothetical protein
MNLFFEVKRMAATSCDDDKTDESDSDDISCIEHLTEELNPEKIAST